MVILVIAVVASNAKLPMFVTPAGIVMLVSEFAKANAVSAMLVTLDGIEYEEPLFLAG
jgi:vacuolar-type H+-ATPase subunit C/Vma6